MNEKLKQQFLLTQNKMLKETLINYVKENKNNSDICNDIDYLERIIIENNTFVNRIVIGNRVKLLQSRFENYKSEFICGNTHFICFESKILLIGKRKNILISKGCRDYDSLISSSFEHLMSFNKKLRHLIEPFTPKGIEYKKLKIEREEREEYVTNSKSELFKTLDKDGNGQIDVIEGDDFNLLLKKHQKQIIDQGRSDNKNYVQQFVQLKNYITNHEKNIQGVFNIIKDITDEDKLLEKSVKVLKNNIHSYEVLLVHSLNMISVLIEDDILTFYDIYEKLDKLNIFNSNYQNEMLNRLSNIEGKLEEVIYSIEDMSMSIVSELDNLTQEIGHSTKLLSENLNSIESSIDLNTLVTGIGSYQMYKINKNTKPLN